VRITVTRSGGFAGISEQIADVETDGLAPVSARQVEQVIHDIGFFGLPPAVASSSVGADLFHYGISVSDGERQHHVEYDDDGESPEAAPLRRLVELVSGLR
jgi:hypothetical protein